MSQKQRVGVVGVGAIGKNHARIYAQLEGVELVGIVDANAEHGERLAAEYGTRYFARVEDLAPLVDAASVAVPTASHLEVARILLEANTHVLVEKPIAASMAEARTLTELAAKHNCILQVGHIERFNPVMKQLEQALDHPRFIESHRLSPFPNRSMDIGVVLDLMIHDLEIILHLVNSPVQKFDAVGIPVMTSREDIANVRLRFESGCVANITASRVSPEKMRKIRVFQENAYLSLDYAAQEGNVTRLSPTGPQLSPVEVEKGEPLAAELTDFIACSREGRRPLVSGQQGAQALELAMAITNVIESGGGEQEFSCS